MTSIAAPYRDVTAADVMTSPVVTVQDSGTIWDAWSVLINCHVHHAVVVSGERCIGIVDDRVLVQAWQRGPSALRSTPIRTLLHDRTSCVLPASPLAHVASLMNTERLEAVPVVDDGGRLLGLITISDILRAVAHFGLRRECASDDALLAGSTR
jgi:CBS-domain-containing membrane protein